MANKPPIMVLPSGLEIPMTAENDNRIRNWAAHVQVMPVTDNDVRAAWSRPDILEMIFGNDRRQI